MPRPISQFPALSVHQPWADLIVHGSNDIANRARPTKFRGTILIHASPVFDEDNGLDYEVIDGLLDLFGGDDGIYVPRADQIIGMLDVIGCVSAHESCWFDGPYGLVLENNVRFSEPVPVKGTKGIFYVPMRLLEGILPEDAVPGRVMGRASDHERRNV